MRSELFNADQMEQYGRKLAGSHILGSYHVLDHHLLERLAENELVLKEVHQIITEAVRAKREITPAGEWLLDNFSLIEEHIHTGKRHLPKGYSKELPRLLNGPSKGLPRVYDLAIETISHGDGRVDPERLRRFIAAYQTVSVLKLGELWAIPIMLRLALIENLRRVSARIADGRIDRNLADSWADQMLEIAKKDPKNLILVIADMARSNPPMTTPFVSEFVRRLQGQSPALALSLTWIEQRLSESGLTIERLVQLGNQQQANDQLSMSNSIDSLRFLGGTNWQEFVEKMSIVEETLRQDPAKVYSKMVFETRDRYRHIIENIARTSSLSEAEVASKTIQLAQQGLASNGEEDRSAHVGFYLIDKGLSQLDRLVMRRFSVLRALRKLNDGFHLTLYAGSILLLTVILAAALLEKVYFDGVHGWLLVPMGLLLFFCVSHLAVAIVNWAATILATPKPLPRMDFSHGIPSEARTLVVIPTMLLNSQSISDMAEALEVRFLANRDENLHFALLTDFLDADKENLPEDESLAQLAKVKIEELNQKYPGTSGDTFFLLHRPRRWNPHDHLWMGYERKRGKLSELNFLLRGGSTDNFSLIAGTTEVLQTVKYVITLDTDTQLPRDSAWQFIGTIAHPLNHARIDKHKHRVCEGYGILQPRVGVSLSGTNLSRYARLFGSEPGIDPYTRTVSDVYQDVFAEGSFIGKGIYDVDIFGQLFDERFPENRILSHDLLEGCYARAGLLSDVLLYEEYPSRYIVDVKRRHRWIRGDWQIIQWVLPFVPGPKGRKQRNPLSGLSRWKIFDNLRRSIIPFVLTLLLLLGWTVLSQAWFWTLSVIGMILIPSMIVFIIDLFHKQDDILQMQHLKAAMRSFGRQFTQAAFTFVFLPFEAFYSMDAILRTITRLMISHEKLLEWNLSGSQDHNKRTDIIGAYQTMWISPVIALATLFYLAISWPVTIAVVWPIPILWFVSPFIAWWFSQKLIYRNERLTAEQNLFLRNLSRKTWSFFETFVGPDDHWLPPDNYQENPVPTIAHRTSPTNMGLALLANLTAYDFGYISAGDLIDRTTKAFQTMENLERYRGHFFNWYDTQSLKPLLPLYVSSVDSGNLAGHLMTLRPGLLELPDHRILEPKLFEAIRDTLRILLEVTEGSSLPHLIQFQKELNLSIISPPTSLSAWHLCLDRLIKSATEITGFFINDPESQSSRWALALSRQCRTALDELTFLMPWLLLPEISEKINDFHGFDEIPTLRGLAKSDVELLPSIRDWPTNNRTPDQIRWFEEFKRSIIDSRDRSVQRIAAIENLALQCGELSMIEYDFLYDKERHLQAIGYNVDERRRDSSFYNLLASEARFCSFVAIAQGKVPQESWFALSRLVTATGGDPVLLSWSGSMFEYLMPLLVMPTYENTLLDQTYKAAVKRQIDYGRQRGFPWGMSESGYNMVDANLNYQYRAFGVPGMGLKRGLADDQVVAPYASFLALMVAPEEACLNLERLILEKMGGKFGLFEAIDYTPSRMPRGQSGVIVKSFMAHHLGMSFLALAYHLLDRPMQKRFKSDTFFQATMLLLQERIPKVTPFYSYTAGISEIHKIPGNQEMPVRVFNTPDTPIPEVHLLSNGRYNVMVTNAGGGYSCFKDLAITRWREDTTCDNWGSFCYIRDLESGEFWSIAHQPTLQQSDHYEAIFSKGRAEFRRRDKDFDTYTEIVVSPEDDIELRRVHITNRSRKSRAIDVTSYAEIVLASSAADALHPAFSNLFVQTEIISQRQAILCTRRPRSVDERIPWMFHLMTMHGAKLREISYETDRLQFIGRGNTIASPQAMKNSSALSCSQGSVLDPIVAIRYQMVLDPEESVNIDMVTGIAKDREAALILVDKYQDRRLANRVFELAWTYSQVILRQINVTEADTQLYGRLASSILYANSSLRAGANTLIKNQQDQSGLWGYSISGDLPIVLLQIEDIANINLVRQLVQAHVYWHLKGLAVDLVIWNEDHAGYRQLLHDQIMGLIAAGVETNIINRPGGIFLRAADQISNEDRILIQTVARVIITDKRGTLAEQINHRSLADIEFPLIKPIRKSRTRFPEEAIIPRNDLVFFNGLGGFTGNGREYVITKSHEQVTPAPWVNVLANPHFGTVISENGLAYTWTENAHEFRLTPWTNDPVSDTAGEAFFIRDEESGNFWSPAPLPSCGINPYTSRHGFGYSVFEHTEGGIRSEMWVYVAPDAAVKFTVLKLKNESGRARKLSVTGYAEWVLGDLRPKSAMHIVTGIDSGTGALFARNSYNMDFTDRVAFFQTDDSNHSISCDRTEFIGRNGTLRNPAAMKRYRLSGRVGAGLDPCAAIQVPVELADGQEREIIFRLGAGLNAGDASNLIRRYWGSSAARNVLEEVWKFWKRILGTIQVETPDQSINMLVNGWLMYQTLACRIWARSGYYQSGGAFGFRDQLQDVMALIHVSPDLVREHILLCASRQFKEGDVQHWWHPPSGRGVRTHCSDDYLWLPLVTSRYVLHTGDTGVLDESVTFLSGRPLKPEDDSYYDLPGQSVAASLYVHCVRAIQKSLYFGEHGLPFIGTGDWNDGMNMVGNEGKGESVWLGFFLYEVLIQFSKVAQLHGDIPMVDRCKQDAAILQKNLEKNGWDGEWYLRAWFDDGSPLGSAKNPECQIDSISQSWSVLSGAGDANRSRIAMDSVSKHLVNRKSNLIQVLNPPFDKSAMNPGYIKGYVPGVRENGGQYTHAAIWAAMAYAKLGDTNHAWELLTMINPINHAITPDEIAKYKVEPYVIAADVYAVAPHIGRGGWTWYTGSAGLMYRLIVESLLGLRLETDKLFIEPCLPANWESFIVHYRYRETIYHITIKQITDIDRKIWMMIDSAESDNDFIPLIDDRQEHSVEIRLAL